MSLLKEKVGYECWLIDYIGKVSTKFLGEGVLDKRTFWDDSTAVHAHIHAYSYIGGSATEDLLKKIYPLFLTSSYKIIDMVFEWVLTENYDGGTFKDVPKSNKWKSPSTWKFVDKVERLTKYKLEYPPFMQSEDFFTRYYFALYKELLPFRNRIIHGSGFSVEGNSLLISLGGGRTLTLSQGQLDSLMNVGVSIIPLVTKEWEFGPYQRNLTRYHMDLLAEIHKLAVFGDKDPLLLQVEYHVHLNNGVFMIDLARIRERIGKSIKDREVHFNLDVVKYDGDRQLGTQHISNENIPSDDVFTIQ
jgi:hypothetical protein